MLKIIAVICLATSLFSVPVFAGTKTGVNVVSPWEVASYDPSVSKYVLQRLQIMESLVDVDANGTLRPGLATEWSVDKDGLTWRFSLRKGVTFHDGSKFDTETAVAALKRSKMKPGILKKAPVAKIAAESGKVVITTTKPFASLPGLLAHADTIIPGPRSFNADGNPVAFIGTGPFKVAEFTPPQSLQLRRFDTYWGKAPKLKTVSYLAVSRAETRSMMAESGDADMVFTFDASGYTRLQNVKTVEVDSVPVPRIVTLKVNAAHPFFKDPKARQALSLAIERNGIAKAITRFPEASATQLFPPVMTAWYSKELPPLKTDIQSAKTLLAELGWVAGKDGILTRNGKRFSITLRTFPNRPELPLIAAALQDQWRKIGIELEVSVANFSEIPKGHRDGTLHVALYARNYGKTPDPISEVLKDFGKGGADWGTMGWENAEVTKALEVAAALIDENARAPYIARVIGILQEELPIIPVVWYHHTASVATKLKGVVFDPLQRSYGLSDAYWVE